MIKRAELVEALFDRLRVPFRSKKVSINKQVCGGIRSISAPFSIKN